MQLYYNSVIRTYNIATYVCMYVETGVAKLSIMVHIQ